MSRIVLASVFFVTCGCMSPRPEDSNLRYAFAVLTGPHKRYQPLF